MKTVNVKSLLNWAAILLVASCTTDTVAPIPVVKLELIAAIAEANVFLTTTFEGVATGNYLKGSQAPLTGAVTIAQVVAANATATQTDVNSATVNMNAAITTYKGQIVVPIDPTNLVGQWTFDQITAATVNAVVKDYSGNSRDGTIKAGHTFWNAGGAGVLPEF